MAEFVSVDILKQKIKNGKSSVMDRCQITLVAAKKLALAYKALSSAVAKRDRKDTAKIRRELSLAEIEFGAAKMEYFHVYYAYDSAFADVASSYEMLALATPSRENKIKKEAEKYELDNFTFRSKLDKILAEVPNIAVELEAFIASQSPAPIAEPEEPEEPEAEEQTQPQQPQQQAQQISPQAYASYQPPYPPYYMPPYYIPQQPQQQSVEIAPMTIDVSRMVEEAMGMVMDKFKAQIEKRIEAAVSEMNIEIPAPTVTAAPVVQTPTDTSAPADAPDAQEQQNAPEAPSVATAALQQVYEDESFVSEKLSALVENIKKLAAQMTELGAACMQISNQQKDATELQRKINDMQRAALREIQGVQATQKVINADQMALSEEQAVILEEEKATLENQRIVAEAQKNMADIQRTVIDTQATIDESMKELIRSQKDIINSQQSLMNANLKNIDLARELTERQADLNAKQKEAMSEHKRLARGTKPRKKAEPKNDEPIETIDSGESDSAPIPDDVALDTLAVEE